MPTPHILRYVKCVAKLYHYNWASLFSKHMSYKYFLRQTIWISFDQKVDNQVELIACVLLNSFRNQSESAIKC